MNHRFCISAIACVAVGGLLGCLSASGRLQAQDRPRPRASRDVPDAPVLPHPPAPFRGVVNLRKNDSKTDFPRPVQAPTGAPNVLLVLLDDVGFGAASTFGGPCNTPNLERLARSGLRYNQFHTTALCSPTRAALLTGRNHHSVHTGVHHGGGHRVPGLRHGDGQGHGDRRRDPQAERLQHGLVRQEPQRPRLADQPGRAVRPLADRPGLRALLRLHRRRHQPMASRRVSRAPSRSSPTSATPTTTSTTTWPTRPSRWIGTQKAISPDRPFFVYYAPGATHAPHHPKKEWIEKYKGKFDQGWDRVREETFARQKQLGVIPAGGQAHAAARRRSRRGRRSPPTRRSVYARMMEIYAAYLEQTDHNVGRVIEAIERGRASSTTRWCIYIVGDNGASAEGSMQGLLNEMTFFNGVPEDLKHVLAPRRRHRDVEDLQPLSRSAGRTRCARRSSGPSRSPRTTAARATGWSSRGPNGSRTRAGCARQWHHVHRRRPDDPRGRRAAGAGLGERRRAEADRRGEHRLHLRRRRRPRRAGRPSTSRCWATAAIYHDGWVACTTPPIAPWDPNSADVDPITGYTWELYHVDEDFTQADDLAAKEPGPTEGPAAPFYTEAARSTTSCRSITAGPAGSIRRTGRASPRGRTSFTFIEGMSRIPEGAAPDIKNKSFSISAEVEVPVQTAVRDDHHPGRPVRRLRPLPRARAAGLPLQLRGRGPYRDRRRRTSTRAGEAYDRIRVHLRRRGHRQGRFGGALRRRREAARGRIERTIPVRVTLDEGLDVGEDTGTPVNLSYDVPFRFPGKIRKVTIDLK